MPSLQRQRNRGTTGLVGDFCRYCRASQFVTLDKKKYKPENIDEVDCPHCNGAGVRGRGEYCAYCRGSQVISGQKAEEYDPEDFDEETYPRCNGRGRQASLATNASSARATVS
jgi:DnaJ-class molecular chaperone